MQKIFHIYNLTKRAKTWIFKITNPAFCPQLNLKKTQYGYEWSNPKKLPTQFLVLSKEINKMAFKKLWVLI